MENILAIGAPSRNASPVVTAPAEPRRRYSHTYAPPSKHFHLTANDEAAELLPAIGRTAFAILECLRSHLNSITGQCNPSLDTIAEEIGATRPTVVANLKYLYEGGVVGRMERDTKRERIIKGKQKTTKQYHANQYILHAREAWTLDRVSRKRSKAPKARENRTTYEENLTTPCPETLQGVVKKFDPNKKNSLNQEEVRTKKKEQQTPTPPLQATPEPPSVVVPPHSSSTQARLCEKKTPKTLHPLVAALIEAGVTRGIACALVREYSADIITAQLEYLPARLDAAEDNCQPVINPGAWLATSIRENWLPPSIYADAQEAAQMAQEAREAQSHAQAMKAQQRASVRQERVSAQEEEARLDAEWEELPAMKREAIEREMQKRVMTVAPFLRGHPFLDSMRRSIQREWATTGGVQ